MTQVLHSVTERGAHNAAAEGKIKGEAGTQEGTVENTSKQRLASG